MISEGAQAHAHNRRNKCGPSYGMICINGVVPKLYKDEPNMILALVTHELAHMQVGGYNHGKEWARHYYRMAKGFRTKVPFGTGRQIIMYDMSFVRQYFRMIRNGTW